MQKKGKGSEKSDLFRAISQLRNICHSVSKFLIPCRSLEILEKGFLKIKFQVIRVPKDTKKQPTKTKTHIPPKAFLMYAGYNGSNLYVILLQLYLAFCLI